MSGRLHQNQLRGKARRKDAPHGGVSPDLRWTRRLYRGLGPTAGGGSLFRWKCGLNPFQEIFRTQVADHAIAQEFLAVAAEEDYARRTKDAEAAVERLVVVVVGSHVRL